MRQRTQVLRTDGVGEQVPWHQGRKSRSGGLGVGVEKMPHTMILIELHNVQAERGLRDSI